jgi:hypothetical protein
MSHAFQPPVPVALPTQSLARFALMASSLAVALIGCNGTVDAPESSPGSADAGFTNGGSDARGETGSPDAGDGTGGESDAGSSTDPFAAARTDCVDRINAFRATLALPALARWNDAESCSDEQSSADANGDGAHANFGMCGEFAQNTCPNWPSTDAVVTGCLQAMWDEGPGEPFSEHGHFLNMSSTQYSKVACSFYEGPNGVWANQNFR